MNLFKRPNPKDDEEFEFFKENLQSRLQSRRLFLAKLGKIGAAAGLAYAGSGLGLGFGSPVTPSNTWYVQAGTRAPAYILDLDNNGNPFAVNAKNGKIDFADTSVPAVLQAVADQFVTDNKVGWVHAKANDYPMGSSTPAVLLKSGFKLTADGSSPDYSASAGNDLQSRKATRFLMGANNQTLFKASSTLAKPVAWFEFRDMDFEANGFTGGTAINMSTTNENSVGAALVSNVTLNNLASDRTTQQGSFGTGFIFDGADDLIIERLVTGLTGTGTIPACSVDIQSNSNGNVVVRDSILYSPIAIQGGWQIADLGGGDSTFSEIKLLASNTPPSQTYLHDAYLGPRPDTAGTMNTFNVNGFAAGKLALENAYIRPWLITVNNSGGYVVKLGGGMLDAFYMKTVTLAGRNTTGAITDSAANCGRYRRYARDVSVQTGNDFSSVSPWVMDANRYLNDIGYGVSTPSFPATGSDQQNTNPHPVIVFITGLGTGITAVGITDPNGTRTDFTRTGEVGDWYWLQTLAKIRLSYTGAPTWKWYGVNE